MQKRSKKRRKNGPGWPLGARTKSHSLPKTRPEVWSCLVVQPLSLMRYAVRSAGIARPERPEANRADAMRRGKTQRRGAACISRLRRLGCLECSLWVCAPIRSYVRMSLLGILVESVWPEWEAPGRPLRTPLGPQRTDRKMGARAPAKNRA
jgi:hypothetical protein